MTQAQFEQLQESVLGDIENRLQLSQQAIPKAAAQIDLQQIVDVAPDQEFSNPSVTSTTLISDNPLAPETMEDRESGERKILSVIECGGHQIIRTERVYQYYRHAHGPVLSLPEEQRIQQSGLQRG